MSYTRDPDCFLSFAEVALLIWVDEGTVRNGEGDTHELTRIKLGRRTLFSFNDVQRWMAAKLRQSEEDRARSEAHNPALQIANRMQRKGINKAVRFKVVK